MEQQGYPYVRKDSRPYTLQMKPSPAFSFIKERLEREFEQLDKERITPWAFFRTEYGWKVMKFDGKEISCRSLEFEGTPRHIFWKAFAQPFLKDIVSRGFADTRSFCKEHGIDATQPMEKTAGELRHGVQRIFNRMVDIDQRLRGKGYPKTVLAHNPATEISPIDAFIGERLNAELLMLPKPKYRWNRFYEEQTFWIWLLGVLIGVAGLVIKLIG